MSTINQQKVQQVREGKASIETLIKNDKVVGDFTDIVDRVMERTGSGFYPVAKYHYLKSNVWFYANANPTGLTTIPLDDFFKEEDRECSILFTPNDFKDISGCLKPYGHLDHHVCKVKGGGLMAWEDDLECTCGCWEDSDGKGCKVYWEVDSVTQPPTPEQPSLPEGNNTLPEELVREHLQVIQSYNPNNVPKVATTITIDYMGRFAEWVEGQGWRRMSFDNGKWSDMDGRGMYTTQELITLFFNHIAESNEKV